ncbi:hypothetical protein SAMN05660841_02039 [Sphingobacterium nematocida]|uniref:Uncharacterized protein n=1 Tax=Sphingobacterium nematocida TaxID=1513896 RepID=A0A1T5DKN9_9SPHI|nr:hypothetical protein SAMN05660841_02039 [Sphingobacterium nematocida]
MVCVYKYFRLCYLYFEDHDDPFFKAIGFVNMALFVFLGILYSIVDLFWPGYLSLPELSKPKLWLYALLNVAIFYYVFKALLVKAMKVDPKSGISHRYDYNPSPKAVKINFIAHVVLLGLVFLFGYLRKTFN